MTQTHTKSLVVYIQFSDLILHTYDYIMCVESLLPANLCLVTGQCLQFKRLHPQYAHKQNIKFQNKIYWQHVGSKQR